MPREHGRSIGACQARSRRGASGLPSAAGSIPTCVGEPESFSLKIPPKKVYPHVCGGTQSIIVSSDVVLRLSPRVWGNPCASLAAAARRRSIPTCVGEPRAPSSPVPVPGVYPHVCGGTDAYCNKLSKSVGLSPRVWGNLQHWTVSVIEPGSIPTCVGEPVLPFLPP